MLEIIIVIMIVIAVILLILVVMTDNVAPLIFMSGVLLVGLVIAAAVAMSDGYDASDLLARYASVEMHSGSVRGEFVARVDGVLAECVFTRNDAHLVCDGNVVAPKS